MARVIIQSENQIKRINDLKNRLTELEKTDLSELTKRPAEKSWCGLEVVEHMNLGHKPYNPKIEKALESLEKVETVIDPVRARSIPSYLIKRFPPSEAGKIRFKMKTMKFFKPVFDPKTIKEEDANKIFQELHGNLEKLSRYVEVYRLKKVEEIRFNSAVGAWVRFNVAEAVEFIICHNERHFKQIENALERVKS